LLPSQAFAQAYILELTGAMLCCVIFILEASGRKKKAKII